MSHLFKRLLHAVPSVIALAGVTSRAVRAQSGVVMARDSALNNLEHSANYRTAAVGALPEIVRRGSGPIDLVIIPGLGFGARDFDAFMQANESRYRMICVTLPGFAGTPAPPMPAAGTSYGDATWTRAAEGAIAAVIARERLRRPVILGHLIVGTQH